MHSDLMYDHFRIRPTVFENTEFTFNNQIAAQVKEMGYPGIFTEGVDRISAGAARTTSTAAMKCPFSCGIFRASDDIAFRFGNQGWDSTR